MSRTSRSSALTAGLLSCRQTSHNPPSSVPAHPRTAIISSSTPSPAPARGRGGTPRGQLIQRLAHLSRTGSELLPAERRQAHPVVGINLAVPLLHPRLQLGQPCHERDEPVVRPAVLFPFPDDQRQGQRLLRMIPPGPAEQ